MTVICAGIIILINSHGLFFVQLIEVDIKRAYHDATSNESLVAHTHAYACGVDLARHPTYGRFYYEHWNTFDFCISTAVPSVLLALFNVKIVYKMRKSIEKFRIDFNLKKSNNSSSPIIHQHSKIKNIYLMRIAKLRQMNFMLMTAVLTFFVFYAPYSIYYMIMYNTNIDTYLDKEGLVGDLLLLWSLFNVTFNFYFYCLTGNTIFRSFFKSEVKRIKGLVF